MTLLNNIERDFDFFDKFFNIQSPRQDNFPRASIFVGTDDNLVFNFALAGYTKDDVQVTFEADKLTIQGRKDNEPIQAKKVYQNQIAFREFHVLYRIPSEYTYSESEPEAKFDNGILEIKLKPKAKIDTKYIKIQ